MANYLSCKKSFHVNLKRIPIISRLISEKNGVHFG